MILLKNIRNLHSHALLNYLKTLSQKPYFVTSSIPPNPNYFSFLSPIAFRPFSLSAHFVPQKSQDSKEKTHKVKKPLSLFFKQAVGISVKTEDSGTESEIPGGNPEVKNKMKNMVQELRSLNKESNQKTELNTNLWALFADEKMKKKVNFVNSNDLGNEDPMVYKELSPDMKMFAHHLYKEGYLNGASFMPKSRFDLICLESSYAREFLKFAAVEFGKDHQEIAKWLSAVDLKRIALFGCPSLGEKSVYAAKNVRRFFEIEEHKVCQLCRLKESCKRANKSPQKSASKLNLADVTRVLVLYAMESVPRQLVITEEIKSSVSRLMNEVVNLSQTVSRV